ncbi:MAG TPA: hypothetical protein VD996_12955 [Chitinophagaceae bacterium]|nr:hypothetical protein [Chitinophagaceae bacterium]
MKRYRKTPSLISCILMDVLGYATYSLPLIGELADIIWAPISALIFFRMFGGWKGAFGGLFNFAEELLPGFDFIPTFTLTWIMQYFTSNNKQEVEKQAGTVTLLQTGNQRP